MRDKKPIKPKHARHTPAYFRAADKGTKGNATTLPKDDDREKHPLFSKESVLRDIRRQNLAGKPCIQASAAALMQGRLEFKAHGFHQKPRLL